MQKAPDIASSTKEERLAYLRRRYVCIANCDACGICASFHGRDPEHALSAYVEGRLGFAEALIRARDGR